MEAFEDFETSNSYQFRAGANWFIEGHNLKVSGEYQRWAGTQELGSPEASDLFRI